MGYISPLLAAKNMKGTIQFYTTQLGFSLGMAFPTIDNPEYVDLIKENMVLMFIPAVNMGVDSGEKLGVGVNLYMSIDSDIDEYYEELKKNSPKIIHDIQDQPYGTREFTLEDINGFQLTFSQKSKSGKNCMSCGMPMSKPEDFCQGNPDNVYCAYCCNPDGSLKSFDEVLEGTINFMVNSQKMDREAAQVAAKQHLCTMPAWSGNTC